MMSCRRLTKLCERAERLGLTGSVADLLEAWIGAAEEAAGDYEDFHWGEVVDSGQVMMVSVPDPVLWQLGELVSVTYEAAKAGEVCHWEHPFDDRRPVLAYGQSETLWIVGGDYTVGPRGIVG
jgi:hypothetical protein